jgi:hypothetical protein
MRGREVVKRPKNSRFNVRVIKTEHCRHLDFPQARFGECLAGSVVRRLLSPGMLWNVFSTCFAGGGKRRIWLAIRLPIENAIQRKIAASRPSVLAVQP